MKYTLTILAILISIPTWSQGVWERPDTEKPVTEKKEKKTTEQDNNIIDEKYMAGAVTENNGKVEWTLDIDVPGKSAVEIYNIMLAFLNDFTKTDNQLEGSCVSLVNKQDHIIVASIKEWLVFKENFLMIDRSKFFYTLMAYCDNAKLKVVMNRIYYRYEEERIKGGHLYKAEEWINDNNALNSKKNKLIRGTAKFRCKTIDRKDQIFEMIQAVVLDK
ncbi:MAG: DUF4468 domain-containing protein [Prevotella sp.]